MPALEVLALDTATPQIRAPGSGDTYSMPRALSQSAGAQTTNVPVQDLAVTWNNAAVAFTAWKLNVTNTASASSSLVVQWQVGGADLLTMRRDGYIRVANNFDLTGNGAVIGIDYLSFSASNNLQLYRDAADILAQRRGANAQTSRVYGTYTDASNYRRLALAMTTAGVASIAPEGAGTGAAGNVLHISGLPVANPGPGILWNDGGTVKVGT